MYIVLLFSNFFIAFVLVSFLANVHTFGKRLAIHRLNQLNAPYNETFDILPTTLRFPYFPNTLNSNYLIVVYIERVPA